MNEAGRTIRVAVVQAASVVMDRAATVAKACRLAQEAAAAGARLALFPEAFVPAYPRGLLFGTTIGARSAAGRGAWQRYWDNAVDVPGPDTEALGAAARETGLYLAVGVVERERGTLYCTLLIFGPDGSLLGRHRKLKPTAAERVVWGEGDGSTLGVARTPLGVIGGLICWENYMPLARAWMYAQGTEIYLAPTADGRDSWQATIRHIACEGRCFVLACNQSVRKSDYPADWPGRDELDSIPDDEWRTGGSAIVDPYGRYLAGPMGDEEGILLAVLDLGEVTRARLDLDVTGHYARPDVFRLLVNTTPGGSCESQAGSEPGE